VSNRKKGETPLQLRQRLGFKQRDFWSRVGVTQSAGSRYETGGLPLPPPIQMLIELAYGDKPLQALGRLRDAS
jgi:transcriptional regulator with XRE-family HTH domain